MRVVATAGHVDHGKSSLVLALTGTDPDRFAEEKRRGLTIDLGFAHTTLPSGAEIASSTCPATSASSATCSPASAASTPACSSSPRPRAGSRRREEHLRILELLGVRHGVVALTKARPRRRRVARARRRSTSPTASPAPSSPMRRSCPSHAPTGAGLDELRAALDELRRRHAAGRRPRPAPAVDRPVVRGQGRRHRRHRHAHRRPARGRRRRGAARGRRRSRPRAGDPVPRHRPSTRSGRATGWR